MNVRARCEAEFQFAAADSPPRKAVRIPPSRSRPNASSVATSRRVPCNSPDTPVHRARSQKMGMFHMPNVSAMTQTASRQEAALKRKTAEQGKPWYVRLVACFTCQCIC